MKYCKQPNKNRAATGTTATKAMVRTIENPSLTNAEYDCEPTAASTKTNAITAQSHTCELVSSGKSVIVFSEFNSVYSLGSFHRLNISSCD